MVLTASNPLHPAYELFAKGIYGYFSGVPATQALVAAQLDSLGYSIDKVFDDPNSSFQALGLVAKDGSRPPVLVSQGTADDKDAIDDANPQGVGFNEFSANKGAVKTWVTGIINDKTKNPAGLKVDFTGQSLGGALSQWFISEFSELTNEAVTFQSPGITKAASDLFVSRGGKPSQVTHYVVNGDLVSLGGEALLPGTLRVGDYQTPAFDPEKFGEKHFASILNPNIPGISVAVTNELPPITVADFNKPTFTFTGQDWQDFVTKLKQNEPIIGAGTDNRASAETLRAKSGNSNLVLAQITRAVSSPNVPGIPGLNLINNLFSPDGSIKGLGVKALSQKLSNKVNELAFLVVDDATGKIGNLAPSDPGYFKVALERVKPLFSTLGGTFFNSISQQEFTVDSGKFYQLLEIQNASLADLRQQLATNPNAIPTNILSALSQTGTSPLKITENTAKDGYQVSINNDELVLNVVKLTNSPNLPIGSKSQGLAQGRTIDLTDYSGKTISLDLTVKSDAGYNNNIGFYAVEDAAGTIKLADGTAIGINDAKYAVEAVKKAIANATLTANKTETKTGQNIAGGSLYAPVVVAKGTLNEFVTAGTNTGDSNAIHAYFSFVGANPDKIDHFRLLGSNTFGVEDLYGGGDRDFNDLVINLNVKNVT